jgi:hypothetical protein
MNKSNETEEEQATDQEQRVIETEVEEKPSTTTTDQDDRHRPTCPPMSDLLPPPTNAKQTQPESTTTNQELTMAPQAINLEYLLARQDQQIAALNRNWEARMELQEQRFVNNHCTWSCYICSKAHPGVKCKQTPKKNNRRETRSWASESESDAEDNLDN